MAFSYVLNTDVGKIRLHIVHYESGNDFIVYITNQSAADIAVLAAY